MTNKVIFEKPRLKMLNGLGYKCVDLHYHTKYSDGQHGVKISVKKAKRLNLGVAITDHNEIRGAVNAYRMKQCTIIPGVEITSREFYDILAYFYDINDLIEFYVKYLKGNELKQGMTNMWRLKLSFIRLLDYAEKYNCVLAPAHPFMIKPKNSFDILQEEYGLLKRFDAVEAINGGMTTTQNLNCFNWAQKLDKPMIGGSDGHSVSIMGSVVNAVKEDSVEGILNSILKKKHILIGKGFNLLSWSYHEINILGRNIRKGLR
jgi:predicted metal-dependent phosphoesterase TrpH